MSELICKNRAEVKDLDMKKNYPAGLEMLFAENDKVVSMDADLMRAIGTVGLWRKHPERVIECGIAEANMIGVAAGLSSEGYVPFVHTFAAFASRRVFDQVFMSCAYAKLNVKIVGSDPGVVAQMNGGTHTANEDIAMMRTLPGVTVVEVTDAVALPQIMRQAAAQYGTFYIRMPRCAVPRVYAEDARLTVGKANVLRDGRDVTIFACGIEVSQALDAADILAAEGIEATVVDVFTIQPLDVETIVREARKTGAVVTAENHSINGGLGSAIAECLGEHCPMPMERIGNLGEFGDVGKLAYLMKRYHLTAEDIAEKVRSVVSRKSE